MIEIGIEYQGKLRCELTHGPTGSTLTTDAPKDNHGMGTTFSPTDLVAGALGACMATVMGIVSAKRGYVFDTASLRVEKHMTLEPPRRIARLVVTLTVPPNVSRGLDADARGVLEDAANTCPVRLSLLDAIDVPVTFEWQE